MENWFAIIGLVDLKILKEGIVLKKWYDEEYEWEIEVIGFNKEDKETERFCRNGEEIGDMYTCTYGCPVNSQGQAIPYWPRYTVTAVNLPIEECVPSVNENMTSRMKHSWRS